MRVPFLLHKLRLARTGTCEKQPRQLCQQCVNTCAEGNKQSQKVTSEKPAFSMQITRAGGSPLSFDIHITATFVCNYLTYACLVPIGVWWVFQKYACVGNHLTFVDIPFKKKHALNGIVFKALWRISHWVHPSARCRFLFREASIIDQVMSDYPCCFKPHVLGQKIDAWGNLP